MSVLGRSTWVCMHVCLCVCMSDTGEGTWWGTERKGLERKHNL